MYNLRTELTNAIFNSLKIDNNMFNQQIVKEKIAHIPDGQLQDFYGKLFNNSHQYLNGIDRVAKVAETFKPSIMEVDELTIEANRLIDLVKAMNNSVYQIHLKTGDRFDDVLDNVKFTSTSDEDISILNQVKPHCNHKLLIVNINSYQTSIEALEAFKSAIKQNGNKSEFQIAHQKVKGLK